MNSLLIDLILSGITYVILTYLAFKLMRKQKPKGNDHDGGQGINLDAPIIDLPPGISWPTEERELSRRKERVLD